MPADVSRTYDKPFFEMHIAWRAEYEAIADLLIKTMEFSSAVDLGCGNAFIISRLQQCGKAVAGVDGSAYALAAAPADVSGLIQIHDLRTPLFVGKFDLAICTDVAEHLEPHFSDVLIHTVCAHSKGLVYFSAAVPGQGGHYHFNEQPHAYWVEKFQRHGFNLQADLTGLARNGLKDVVHAVWWIAQNSVVLRAG
jgi:SAM-dependent methyltransferase